MRARRRPAITALVDETDDLTPTAHPDRRPHRRPRTAITLTQSDFHDLVRLASAPLDDHEAALLSADRVTAAGRLPELPAERRRSLVARMGLFGLRHTIEGVRLGTIPSAQALAVELVELRPARGDVHADADAAGVELEARLEQMVERTKAERPEREPREPFVW